MFQDLVASEVKWLRSLSKEEKKLCSGNRWTLGAGNSFPLNHYCYSGAGEVALVLLRIQPCCVVAHTYWKDMGKKWYENVLKPWVDKHQLIQQGFRIGMIPSRAAYYLSDDGRQGFGNGAIFKDTRSLQAGLVDEVFNRTTHPVTMEELHQCFGHPSSITHGPQGDSGITYRFQKLKEFFSVGNEDICCFPCIKFRAHSQEALAVGQHFRMCREALLTLGVSIVFDIDEQEKWSDDDIISCWQAAAGGDAIDVLLADDVLWRRLTFHDRHQRLLRNVRMR